MYCSSLIFRILAILVEQDDSPFFLFFKGTSRWITGDLPLFSLPHSIFFCQLSHSQIYSSIIKFRMGKLTIYEGNQRREWALPCFRDEDYIILSDSQFRRINNRDLERTWDFQYISFFRHLSSWSSKWSLLVYLTQFLYSPPEIHAVGKSSWKKRDLNFSDNFPSSFQLSNFTQNFPTAAKLSNCSKTFQLQKNSERNFQIRSVLSYLNKNFPNLLDSFQLKRKLSSFSTFQVETVQLLVLSNCSCWLHVFRSSILIIRFVVQLENWSKYYIQSI